MNQTMRLALALGLTALMGLGTVAAADVTSNGRSDQWHDGNNRGYDNERGYDNNRGNDNGWNRGSRWGRNDEMEGTWRLESRRGDVGRGGWLSNLRMGAATLPNVILIEQSRRTMQVENANGRTLRQIDLGRGSGTVHAVTEMGNGRTVSESFTVRNRGRELVVRTVVSGRRGATQEFTSVYQRA